MLCHGEALLKNFPCHWYEIEQKDEQKSDHVMLFEITPLVVFPDNFCEQRMFDEDKNKNGRIQSQSENLKCYLK